MCAGGASTKKKNADVVDNPDALLKNAISELDKLNKQALNDKFSYPGSEPLCTPFALTLKKKSLDGECLRVGAWTWDATSHAAPSLTVPLALCRCRLPA